MSPVRTRAGTAGSACRSTCGRETGDSGDRRALRLSQPALPAAPARRRPFGRFSFVGGLSAACLADRAGYLVPATVVSLAVTRTDTLLAAIGSRIPRAGTH